MYSFRRWADQFFVPLSIGSIMFFSTLVMADFKDPLDLPAKSQINIENRPLIDIERVGEALVAVGSRGLIAVSEDSGKTWKQAQSPVQSDLVAVYFPTATKGWAVGHDGVILHSEDGGLTWEKQLDGRQAKVIFNKFYEKGLDGSKPAVVAAKELTALNYRDGPSLPFLDVWFQDENQGYVTGAFGNLAVTRNGGEDWEPWVHKIENDAAYHLNSIQGIGEQVFIASERGALFKMGKDRESFELIETPFPGTFFGVTGNSRVVLAYGLKGGVYRSSDQGETWEEVKGVPDSTITNGTQLSEKDGVVLVNKEGELIVFGKDARNFEVIASELGENFTSVVPVSSGDLVVTGLQGVRSVSITTRSVSSVTPSEQ